MAVTYNRWTEQKIFANEDIVDYITELHNHIEILERKNVKLENELKFVARKGGRPAALTKEQQEAMIDDRWRNGTTIRKLAEKYGCSVGVAHKTVKHVAIRG